MIKRAAAAIAVSTFGLAVGAGASFAAGQEIPCGTPAVPAVYDWVVTQPAVAEVSHLDYQWVRQTSPEQTVLHWERVTTTTIYQWKLWVPNTAVPQQQWSATSPGDGWVNTGESRVTEVPAVTEEVTSYEFRRWNQKNAEFFGASRWSVDPKWNANDSNAKAEGWEPTGNTRPETVVVTPGSTLTEYRWEQDLPDGEWTTQESATSPGEGWERGDVVSSTSTTEDAWSESAPEGDGWVKTGESRVIPATFEYRWAATSPGTGWTQTDAEPKKVIDVQATPEDKAWQEVTPAVPAGAPCVEEPPVDETPVDGTPVDETPVDEPPTEEPVDEPAAPEEVPATPEAKPVVKAVAAKPKPASAIPQVETAQAVSPTRLAHTGTDLTLLWTGLGLVVIGAGLGAGHRKVSRES